MLLNPKAHSRAYPDERSRQIMLDTIAFFEQKGKRQLKQDSQARTWYADFLDFQRDCQIFADLLTPKAYGASPDARWDTWRNCEFNEILAFYGLPYWYTWQVSILGLGPIWMSQNEAQKQRAAQLLRDGAVFAYGLSEREHGADIYSTEMSLTPQPDGSYRANGRKYYIGNANIAPMVSTFGKLADSGDYVFFSADYRHKDYQLVQNIVDSQMYVGEFVLRDYPVAADEILSRGQEAWDACLNTVNVGKYNLGWASIGVCTHAFYEAIHHAAHRRLYKMSVTDFPHVQQMFVEAYARLVAMKLFALRAADYQRSATLQDRRYLLYNPVVKMKVTTQGEEVINLLWDIIAAKGFEKDTYFEAAARDIRALPKLEGTVHVNIALIVKFMANYFLNPQAYPEMPRRDDAADDTFLFQQGPTGGLGQVRFHSYQPTLERWDLPNVRLFREQVATYRRMLLQATPNDAQQRSTDWMLALGELFTQVVYAQLILENASIYGVEPELVEAMAEGWVRDVARHALTLYQKPQTTAEQASFCQQLLVRPASDPGAFGRVWQSVLALADAYEMSP